jgi:hypothetical protein
VNPKNALKTVLILSAFTIVLFSGCGAQPNKKALLKQQGLLCSFETVPSETAIGDFDWETNGYVKLEQFKKYASNGKYTAQAVFSVPADFMTTTKAAKVTSWLAGMTMDINTLTKLKVTNWSEYKKFCVDVYVPDNTQRDLNIKLLDANGNEYKTIRPIKNGRNKLELIIQEVKDARVDTTAIVSFSLYLDNKGVDKDVTLFIDNVRLTP